MGDDIKDMIASIAKTVNGLDAKMDAMMIQQGQHQVMLNHDKERLNDHENRIKWLEKLIYAGIGAGGLGGATITKLFFCN